MWRKGRQGEKAGNQNHCCDHVAQDHCCGNAAHQKSQQPIVRDGKVGVSRLPEEDAREDHCCQCGNVAHDHCCDNAVHQPIVRGKVGVAWLCGDTTNIVIRIYPFHFHQMHICKHFTRSSLISPVRRGLSPTSPLRGSPEEDHPEEDHPCAEADAEADFVFEKVFTFGPACSYLLYMDY